MSKKIIGVVVPIILAVIGLFAAGAETSWTFDFSQTNIGQIGDNIINNYLAQQGIDVEGFRALCNSGEVEAQFVKYCDLI